MSTTPETPITRADFEALRADVAALRADFLAAIQHQAWLASLPVEEVDDETLRHLEAAMNDPGPAISFEELQREFDL